MESQTKGDPRMWKITARLDHEDGSKSIMEIDNLFTEQKDRILKVWKEFYKGWKVEAELM